MVSCRENRGSNFILEGMLRREIPMAWGTTTDSLNPEINAFQYAIEIKHLTLKIRPRTLFRMVEVDPH